MLYLLSNQILSVFPSCITFFLYFSFILIKNRAFKNIYPFFSSFILDLTFKKVEYAP